MCFFYLFGITTCYSCKCSIMWCITNYRTYVFPKCTALLNEQCFTLLKNVFFHWLINSQNSFLVITHWVGSSCRAAYGTKKTWLSKRSFYQEENVTFTAPLFYHTSHLKVSTGKCSLLVLLNLNITPTSLH